MHMLAARNHSFLVDDGQSTNIRILCVDDHPLVHRLVRAHLANTSYVLESAGAAEEALAAVERQLPDLMLVDARMPGTDGFELCARLQALPCRIPVVFLSSHGSEEHRARAFLAGAVDYVQKPILRPLLLHVLAEHTSGARHGSELYLVPRSLPPAS